jgi:hypothetical protein
MFLLINEWINIKFTLQVEQIVTKVWRQDVAFAVVELTLAVHFT